MCHIFRWIKKFLFAYTNEELFFSAARALRPCTRTTKPVLLKWSNLRIEIQMCARIITRNEFDWRVAAIFITEPFFATAFLSFFSFYLFSIFFLFEFFLSIIFHQSIDSKYFHWNYDLFLRCISMFDVRPCAPPPRCLYTFERKRAKWRQNRHCVRRISFAFNKYATVFFSFLFTRSTYSIKL